MTAYAPRDVMVVIGLLLTVLSVSTSEHGHGVVFARTMSAFPMRCSLCRRGPLS